MTEKITRASGALPDSYPLYAPGLHRRPRASADACYWIPPPKDLSAGYRPKSITLPPGLTEDEIAAQCRRLWLGLLAWRLGRPNGPTCYSIAWLIKRYLEDEQSPYHQNLGHRAQRTYAQFCKILTADVGERRIDPDGTRPRILGEHVRTWHKMWGKPGPDGKATTPARARHLIVQLRLLVSYAIELGVPGAQEFRGMLSAMRFPVPLPRMVAPSRAQVHALVAKAIEDDYQSIAITTLAQFELIERRTHIIGSYIKGQWRPGWNWADVSDDWTITYFQTKVGRVERSYDLKTVPALLALLQAVPKERRIGAIIKCERTGEPWHERHYAEVFRDLARAAGLPDEIKSMDMRAGGATEADATEGVTDRKLQDAGGWQDSKTKDRYRRNKQRNAQNVVELRQKAREP